MLTAAPTRSASMTWSAAIESATHALSRYANLGSGDQASLERSVADWLYQHWYLAGRFPSEPTSVMPLEVRLAHAVRSALPMTDGWTVVGGSADGRCTATQKGEQVAVGRGSVCGPDSGVVPRWANANNFVRPVIWFVDPATDYWVAARGTLEGPLVRLYINVSTASAPTAVGILAPALGRNWSLKVPRSPAGFGRPDTIVAYVPGPLSAAAAASIRHAAAEISPLTRGNIPPLTFRLARGVAIAEDPGGSTSFGEHRCHAIARVLIGSATSEKAAAEALIDSDHPYRTVGSALCDGLTFKEPT
jgi:hypothetical protein